MAVSCKTISGRMHILFLFLKTVTAKSQLKYLTPSTVVRTVGVGSTLAVRVSLKRHPSLLSIPN